LGLGMLACGTVCQPTIIQREIEKFPSSTSPVRVETDHGEGFIKGIGNPLGRPPLISELVAAELGTWFGLKIPPFAVIGAPQIEIIMQKNGMPMLPPLFFSLAVDGTPRDGSDTFLSRLSDESDVSRLVIFDTWIRNWDRYFDGEDNSDNLLYARRSGDRRYDLVPIDHSSCFVEDDFTAQAAPENWVCDTNIYGKFPEFDDYINARSVNDAVTQLGALNRDFVDEIVNSVPPEWGLTRRAAISLVNLICGRAEYVVNTIAARLVDAPELNLGNAGG